MRVQAGLGSLALLGAVLAAAPAAAAIDLSIGVATYTYASFDTTGGGIANNIVGLGGDGVSNDDAGFWTATTTFNLPAAHPAEELIIGNLAADDRVVVQLNGVAIASAGIGGALTGNSQLPGYDPNAGTGTFIFTPNGAQVAWRFDPNGTAYSGILGPFNVGTNTLTLIVNNTYQGIAGGLTQGPSSLYFSASFQPLPSGGGDPGSTAPEPSAWALMLLGFGGLGAALRRQRAEAAATA